MNLIDAPIRKYCENKIEQNVQAIAAGDHDFRNKHGAGAHVLRYAGRLVYTETFVNGDEWRSSVNVSPAMRSAVCSEVHTSPEGQETVLFEEGDSFDNLPLRSLARVTRATMHARKLAPPAN